MNRSIVKTLVAGLIAAAALAAPAQAGHRSYGHGHHAKFHHVQVHKFHAYRPVHVHYVPVCLKHEWVYSYGHKKLVCVFWK